MWWWRRLGSWGSCCGRSGGSGKAQQLRLLRETDLAHQFGVTWIGAQGIECEVGPKSEQRAVVLLVGGVEPLEGVVLVAQIGV